jgi:hypothetical protein
MGAAIMSVRSMTIQVVNTENDMDGLLEENLPTISDHLNAIAPFMMM